MTDRHDIDADSEPKDPRSALNSVLLLSIIVAMGYGLPMALLPDLLWDTIGGVDEAAADLLASQRWAGAVLLSVAFGTLLVLRKPRGQRTFVTFLAVEHAAAAAALLYTATSDEFPGHDWFVWGAVAVVTVTSALLWWVRVLARKVIA